MLLRFMATLLAAALLTGCAAPIGTSLPSDAAEESISSTASPAVTEPVKPADDTVLPIEPPVTEPVTTEPPATEPVATVPPEETPIDPYRMTDEERLAYLDFTLELFRTCADPTVAENTLVSPLSVLTALGMTMNGAANETLSEMESAFGLTQDAMNTLFSSYLPALPKGDGYRLVPAQSIWIRDTPSLTVHDAFLDVNRTVYNAQVERAAFDMATCDAINAWVNEKTEGMIPTILREITDESMLFLINALAFVGEWKKGYDPEDVWDDSFTNTDGSAVTVPMMHSREDTSLHFDNAVGFRKDYKGRKYAFAAILPDEGVTVDEFLASLTLEDFSKNIRYGYEADITTTMPKFTATYEKELSGILAAMGMPSLFTNAADLTAMGESAIGNLYVSRVYHKTFIEVDEVGTKAAAATAVDVATESFVEPLTITLDRPFVYMILDCKNNIPVFIGTVEQLEK